MTKKINLTIWLRDGRSLSGKFGWHEAVARILVFTADKQSVGFLFKEAR